MHTASGSAPLLVIAPARRSKTSEFAAGLSEIEMAGAPVLLGLDPPQQPTPNQLVNGLAGGCGADPQERGGVADVENICVSYEVEEFELGEG
jgi:hypothetical protein